MAAIRHKRTHWARHAFGGFVVVWLNLVLQPCAMALDGSSPRDCPNCPPEHGGEYAVHAEAIGDMSMAEMSCASDTDCGFTDDVNYDGRNFKLKLKDLPSDLPLAISPVFLQVPALQTTVSPDWHRLRSPPPGNSTPLNILHCVYLK